MSIAIIELNYVESNYIAWSNLFYSADLANSFTLGAKTCINSSRRFMQIESKIDQQCQEDASYYSIMTQKRVVAVKCHLAIKSAVKCISC